MAVKVKLNARGRALVDRAGGVKASFKLDATTGGAPVKASTVAQMLPSRTLVVPGDGLFASGSDELSTVGQRYVRSLAPQLKEAKALTCVGHTDAVGSPELNQALGLRRAQAVCAFVRKLGVKAKVSCVQRRRDPPARDQRDRDRSLPQPSRRDRRRLPLTMDGTSSAISLRALATAAFALAALLAAGVLFLGLGGGDTAVAQTGCVTGTFAYDAAEQRRQRAFEARLGNGAELPAPGFHESAPDMTATLHAAVALLRRRLLPPRHGHHRAARARGRRLGAADPAVAAPREQRAALVAITQSVQLTCDAPRVEAVRDFAAPYYAGLAAQ